MNEQSVRHGQDFVYSNGLHEESSVRANFALMESMQVLERYLDKNVHEPIKNGEAFAMATAQLEILLEGTRESLSGILMREDFDILLNLYAGDPSPLIYSETLVARFMAYLGLEPYGLAFEELPESVQRLCELTHLQSVTLWDAVTRVGNSMGEETIETLDALGIQLID